MPKRLTMTRRDFTVQSAGLAALSLPASSLLAQTAKKVRYIVALPTLSLVTANQTSIPTQLGYYASEGIVLEPSAAGQGGVAAATQLVASGQQDVGSGTQSAILSRAAEGQDLSLVFFYNQIRDFHYVVATLPEAAINSFAELKGKTVGVSTLASEGAVVGRYLMRQSGLSPNDISFLAVGGGAQALNAIRTGQVQAIVNLEAAFAPMEALGQNFKYLPNPPGTEEVFGPGLYVRRDYLAANPKTLVGIGRSVAKSTVFLMHNPEAAVRIHYKAYPEQMPKGVPEEQALRDGVRTLRVQMKGLQLEDKSAKWGSYPAQGWNAYLKIYGLAEKIGDPTRFYTNDLIAEINDFDAQKVIEQAKNFRL